MLAARVVEIGVGAAAMLTGANSGDVLAVFERCAYLQDPLGQLCCIGDPTIGSGPLNLLVDPDASIKVNLRDIWRSSGQQLCMGDSTFALAERVWRPQHQSIGMTSLRQGLAALGDNRAVEPRGLAAPCAGHGLSYAIAKSAAVKISAVRAWLTRRSANPLPESVIELIGLGAGLTPAGDDYLGGVLIGLHARGATDQAARLADLVLTHAPARTNSISVAHLRQAAQGHGSAALHGAIAALADGGAGLEAALRAIDKIGHTSGWDALTGVVDGLKADLR